MITEAHGKDYKRNTNQTRPMLIYNSLLGLFEKFWIISYYVLICFVITHVLTGS